MFQKQTRKKVACSKSFFFMKKSQYSIWGEGKKCKFHENDQMNFCFERLKSEKPDKKNTSHEMQNWARWKTSSLLCLLLNHEMHLLSLSLPLFLFFFNWLRPKINLFVFFFFASASFLFLFNDLEQNLQCLQNTDEKKKRFLTKNFCKKYIVSSSREFWIWSSHYLFRFFYFCIHFRV